LPVTMLGRNQRRHLGVASAAGICIASMIGSGIFSVPGIIGPSLGTPFNVLLAWTLGAVLALCGGFIVAEIAAANPTAGSVYHTIHNTLGARTGYLFGTVSVFVGYIASLAVVALITAAYAHHFLPEIDVRLLATAFIVVPATIHALKVIAGARLNDAFVALKLAIMAVFIGAGMFTHIDPITASAAAMAEAPPPAPFSIAVGAAVISINFAYLGWSSVNTVAGEVRRPQRTLPIAILGAVAVVTTTYLLINIVFMRAIPPAAMVGADDEPMADIGAVVARLYFGEIGGDIVTLAIIAILLSTLTTMLFTGSRLFLAMAWKGELPASLGRCNAAGAPSTSIAWYAGISIVLLWVAPVEALLEYTGLLTTFCAALAGVTVLVLRRNVRGRPFSMPLHPLPACVFLALSGWLLVSSAWADPTVTLASIGTILCIVLLRPVLTRNPTT